MNNIYYLAWTFDPVLGALSAKFKSFADLEAWRNKHGCTVNAIHEYRNNHFHRVIFEDDKGKTERIKAMSREEQKRHEEAIRNELMQHLYVDFVNGCKWI